MLLRKGIVIINCVFLAESWVVVVVFLIFYNVFLGMYVEVDCLWVVCAVDKRLIRVTTCAGLYIHPRLALLLIPLV